MIRKLFRGTLCAAAVAALSTVPAAAVDIIPFKEVRPGMKGVGRTVFKGTGVEEFAVEIVATLENVLPKRNLILARLEGGPLRETGILEGMSGSPVYLGGRLAGAVAYSWSFAKEPLCGVTPIEEMMEMLERGVDLPADRTRAVKPTAAPGSLSLLARPAAMVAFLQRQYLRLGAPSAGPAPSPQGLELLRPTVVLSGFLPEVARSWFPAFEAMSLRPVVGGSPASDAPGARGADLTAGSAFGVTLVRGDMDVTAIGTVTHVEGDKVLAMGHPLLLLGPAAMPMTRAHVFGHFPSAASSFKLAGPAGEVGAITQDRFPGLAGRIGASVDMVPVRVELRRSGTSSRSFRFDIVPDPLLTPGLLHMSLLSLLASEEKQAGDVTIRLREGSRIHVSGDLDVKLENLFSGEMSVAYAAGTVAYMTYLLLNNEDRSSGIEGINLLVDYEDGRRTARIQKIWLERYTVRPGETMTLHVQLQPFRGDTVVVDLPLAIPEEAPAGKALLQVGDSLTLSRMESASGAAPFAPRSLEHLVWLLNHIRLNQKVYATLIRPDTGAVLAGERLPNLPPSIASILLRPRAEQDGSSRLHFRTLLEADADTVHSVRGYQKTLLEVRR